MSWGLTFWFGIGIVVLCVVLSEIDERNEHADALKRSETECVKAGGVLARTASGYACVVPLHKAT